MNVKNPKTRPVVFGIIRMQYSLPLAPIVNDPNQTGKKIFKKVLTLYAG